MVKGEAYVDSHRGNLAYPHACDSIAKYLTNRLDIVIYNEIIPELDRFTTVATKIYRDKRSYENVWDPKFDREDFIQKLGNDAIVDADVRRVLPYYAKGLKDKVIGYIVDWVCIGGQIRNQWEDDNVHNLFRDTIPQDYHPEYWIVTYTNEAYYYYFYYAVDPGNYAEAKKTGKPTPKWNELKKMFPIDEIMGQTDLTVYRRESLQRFNFMNVGWKTTIDSTIVNKQ
ncbi:MAG: hypothetical protein WCH65_00310 [bacterium]